MSSNHSLRLLLLAGLGSALAAPALAQDDSYYYLGLGLGASGARIDEERITANLLAAGLGTTGFSHDQRGLSYKLFGGYQVNRYFGVEAGYFDLGKFGIVATTAPTGALAGQSRMAGINLDLVGTLPFTERWSLIGRVGAQLARTRDTFVGSGAVSALNPNPSARDTNYKLGAGLQYEVNRSFLVRAEAERYRVNDAVGNRGDINVVTVSLVFPIGRAPLPAPRMAAAPVYVAPPAPPPAVVAVVEPPPAAPPAAVVAPPARRRVSFSAESLFGFDRFDIKPEGRAALDRFVAETQGTRYDIITVEGHTDRLGTPEYNLALSTRRADAVKAYLVSAGGIEAAKISIIGKGESAPLTQTADCKGQRASASLIACLQPDRRVEIEVVGTR